MKMKPNKINIENSDNYSTNSQNFLMDNSEKRILINRIIHKWLIGILILVVSLAIISLAIGYFSSLSYLESFRIIFGSGYVLFLPGFILSFIFFPKTHEFEDKKKDENKEKGSIDWIERIALSFALSIAVVPLAVFYLNLIEVKINLLNSFLTILGIIIISLIILYFRIKRLKNIENCDNLNNFNSILINAIYP